MKKSLLLLIGLIISLTLKAQSFNVTGTVTDTEKNPIFYAVVNIKNTNIYATSDEKGRFTIKMPKGKNTITITSLGYVPFEMDLNVILDIKNLSIELKQATLEIDEIVVTAKQSQSKQGTSSYRIGEDAIKQVQAMSLPDIMQLLPGQKITPPNFNSSQQINLRNSGVEGQKVNAFGTSIIVDGTPISNDANMQAANPSVGTSGGANVVNGGVDLREIQVGNIESVEVVAGVASAKYGNITSGTVIVKRKAGYTPFYVTFNTTPSSYQFNGSKGFKLPGNMGYLNTDIDYTYSNARPTEEAHYYQRVGIGLRWTSTLNKRLNWTNTVALNIGGQQDGLKKEEDRVTPSYSESRNRRFSLSINGRANVLGNLNYTISTSYSKQYTLLENEERGPVPVVQPLETGTYFTTYSPLSFMQRTEMEGGPVNLYTRIDASQIVSSGIYEFSFLTGMEYSFDKNTGSGRVTSGTAVMPSNMPGSRGAKFHEIPASTMMSLYHEADLTRKGEHSKYLLRAGLRYDYMNSRYNLLSPRISASAQYFDKLRVRAAWGISYKAPSMMSLYPGPVYFDITNLSYYHNDPASRLAIVTTYVHQPTNEYLNPSKGDTKEIGVDWESRGTAIRLTAYKKRLTDGITTYNQLMVLEKQNYRVVSQPQGAQPIVEPIDGDITYIPRIFSTYVNNQEIDSKGLEFTIEPPKIKSTNTSFMLSGSIAQTETYQSLPAIRSSQISGTTQATRYGVYSSTKQKRSVGTANLTVIQHLTKLRMLITFITELNIFEDRSAKDQSIYPQGYYTSNGQYIDLPNGEGASQEYSDLHLSPNTYNYITPPFYPNFHLNIRKETKQGHSFSFYANNCLWYNPEYTNDVSHTRVRLNSRVSFGFGVSIKL